MRVINPSLSITFSKDEADWSPFLNSCYEKFLTLPPKIYIKQSSTGHALYALDSIKKGDIVLEYLGEWNPEQRQSTYRFGPIDGLYYRNYGAMADDSFPNMAACYLYDVGGLPLRIVFLALEDIAPHQILTLNYGMRHGVKLIQHQECRLEQLISFFRDQNFADIVKDWKRLRSLPRSELGSYNVDLENLTAKMQYIFQTPTSFSLVKTVVDPEQLIDFFMKPDHRFYLLGFSLFPHAREKEVISLLTSSGDLSFS